MYCILHYGITTPSSPGGVLLHLSESIDIFLNVLIAQLVEHRAENSGVVSSSLT